MIEKSAILKSFNERCKNTLMETLEIKYIGVFGAKIKYIDVFGAKKDITSII